MQKTWKQANICTLKVVPFDNLVSWVPVFFLERASENFPDLHLGLLDPIHYANKVLGGILGNFTAGNPSFSNFRG